MAGLQEWIHSMEEGAGARALKFFLLLLAAVALTALYDFRHYRNFATQEAMDAAQVGRHLAEGRGFTTKFIRPFSLYLLQRRVNEQVEARLKLLPADRKTWTPEQRAAMEEILARGQLRGPHPDLANAPVYPAVLAGLMHWLPFDFDSARTAKTLRHQPEVIIALFNQALLFLAVALVFFLGRRLFDEAVGWLAAAVLLGTELFWRFTVSGLSTLLLLVIFLGVVWCLVALEEGVDEGLWGTGRLVVVAALAGLLMGMGALTRYAFGWLIVPVIVFMGVFLGPRRVLLYLVTLGVFALVLAPWLARNRELSGNFFGTAGYAVYEGTPSFPDTHLPRALEPDFGQVETRDLFQKLLNHGKDILANDLPKLGGNWISAFFLVGLLLPFRGVGLTRLRYFLVMCLGLLGVVQALGRTQLSQDSPEINSENLLVLLAPLVFIYGAALFFTLLDHVRSAILEARSIFIIGFALLVSAPLLLNLAFHRVYPLAYPPYYPPRIQMLGTWMKPDELMMSDIPWAVAWYGDRPCLWLTLNSGSEFRAVCRKKPVQALYLTPRTLDGRFLSNWVHGENEGWGFFLLETLLKREVPTGFPLQKAPLGFFPEQLFLSDVERWVKPGR